MGFNLNSQGLSPLENNDNGQPPMGLNGLTCMVLRINLHIPCILLHMGHKNGHF